MRSVTSTKVGPPLYGAKWIGLNDEEIKRLTVMNGTLSMISVRVECVDDRVVPRQIDHRQDNGSGGATGT